MGAMKTLYTKRNEGMYIPEIPTKQSLEEQGYKVITIPDGITNINEIEAPKKKRSNTKEQTQRKIIKTLEKVITKQQKKKKTLIKTASIKDVQKALGKKYSIERDLNYKCRRWIVINGTKEWFIRYNEPLYCAIQEIETIGAVAFLKKYSMISKYN